MRTLIVLTARNAQKRVFRQFEHLRELFGQTLNVSCLIIDDASSDGTYEEISNALSVRPWPACTLIRNPNPLGPGGNQKVAMRHAIDAQFDSALVVLSESAYHFPTLPSLIEQFHSDTLADFLLTTEQFTWRSIRAWPRWAHHRILCYIGNVFAGARIADWQGPLRMYRTRALKKIAFELDAHEMHFHVEVLLQLIAARLHRSLTSSLVLEPRVRSAWPGWSDWKALKAALKFRLQRYNLFYDFRYHPTLILPELQQQGTLPSHYNHKAESNSPHSKVCENHELVPPNSRVLDIGCSSGYVARRLIDKKGCSVVGVDILDPSQVEKGFEYYQLNLENDGDQLAQIIQKDQFDVILILDVLEHLSTPELFLLNLYRHRYQKIPKIIVSTGNVGFIVLRLMLLGGYFNYGNKGILDITHKRLFTLRTFKNLLDQTGFAVLRRHAFPLPWKELGLPTWFCRGLETIQALLIVLRPTLFAYQVLYVTMPRVLPYRHSGAGMSVSGRSY